MPITLPLQDEASFDQAVTNAEDVTSRHADQDVYDILRRQIWDGRRPDVLDADLGPDKLMQFSDQPLESLSPFGRPPLDKLYAFGIHLAMMGCPHELGKRRTTLPRVVHLEQPCPPVGNRSRGPAG